ncbi:hypothetical protein IGI04_014011, partial [Brassica rapa subsp. trilocularis]
MRRSDWEKGFVGMFVATEDIGQQRKTKDEDAEHGEDLNHNEDEEEKTDEKENKDEEYQKVKEQRKDKNHSMSNSEKLDKLIQMVRDLDKRVVMIQNVLGVKFNDGLPNKEDCENGASSGDRRSAQDYENEEDTIDEEANSDTIAEEANSGDGRSALDEENEKEICDEEAKSDEDTEKLESKSCLKQTLRRLLQHSILQTLIQGYKINIFYKALFHRLIQHLRLLSLISFNKKVIVERVLMRDVCEIHVFQPLMKIKKRLVQQDSQVNKDVEPPLQKKFKADTDNVPLRRIERGQIPSIHTQPPFTGARKKHPILHPFEPVDKTRKEKMREWKMSNKRKKLRINQEIVTAKWFSDIETPGKKLSKTHIEAGFELLKLRQINNPDLFLNKTALVVGVKFLEEIDEFYDEFLDDKKSFQIGAGFDKYNIEKNINFLYLAIAVAEKYWLGVVVNLEKRSITTFNCAAMKFTDASLVLYVNAYAMALPFMIRNFFKDVSMDTSKFSIKIVSEGFPKILKIEDIGFYALKLIECHAMRIVDMTKLSEEKIAIIREKLAKKGKLLSIAKDCEVEVSIQEDRFRGSWYRAILEQNPTRVKRKKLRVSYKTMCNEDGVNPLKETIERSFIRPVPPECLNEGAVFKEGSVVDAYFNNGWWTGVIVVERPDGSFLVYFDDQPDIMRFIRNQLRPHADWIGSKWVKSKNKGFSLYMIVLELRVLSQHMFRRGKLVEMTREISEKVRKQGDDRRKFLIKRCTISQNSSDEAEEKHLIVDICKIRPSPPRDLCAEYSLNDYVEVVVTHGWRKGRVTEILLENKYKVDFAATKEDAVFNYTEIRLSMEWLGGGSWIRAHEREFKNNAATPIRPAQESPSNTLALESDEDDTLNDDATEIKSSRESHSNTSFLKATETETQNHEPVDVVELPLPHESDVMMDDVATPIIDPQEIPRAGGKHLIVDICKIRPSPPRDLCAEYSLNDYVEVVVTHGWRKGRVTEILFENKYKVYFAATKEDAVFNYTEIRLLMEWLRGGSWIRAHEVVELPLPHESDVMMDDVATLIIDPQEIPRVDICKIRSSPPRDLCAEYNLNDYVEVVVTHGWRKGRVAEILLENKYKVYFAATKEDAVFNYTEIRLSMEWLGGGSWIRAHEREFENNAATPIRPAQESPSNTLDLESDEDDTLNDDATEIKSSRESHMELPLPHESDVMMDDVATLIIDPQEIPREVRKKGDDRRKFLIKRCTISQNSSDEAEGTHLIVDICKIRPSPPRDLCAEYSLNDYVEVVVTHGWRKGRVAEILLENKYKVYFAATKEDAVFNYTEIRLSMEWLGGGSWIRAHEREFKNNAATPIRPAQESPSNTLALESDEDDTLNDDATEIKFSRESHSNTSFLKATETETQNHEPVDVVELPLPHESDVMMDDVATPIIDPQEIPR